MNILKSPKRIQLLNKIFKDKGLITFIEHLAGKSHYYFLDGFSRYF